MRSLLSLFDRDCGIPAKNTSCLLHFLDLSFKQVFSSYPNWSCRSISKLFEAFQQICAEVFRCFYRKIRRVTFAIRIMRHIPLGRRDGKWSMVM